MDGEPSNGVSARIALLPERVRNQIAAGEVIERPASVVKELLENALDAGAHHVRIDLEEGGVRLVRVSDDGSGMPREDVELAFVAHATSKLRDVGDLDHIASLGFRGEALASMGAVARCRIFSRTQGSATGWRIENEGGKLGEIVESGGPAGTSVEVRDLFYNVPARRRFLKQTATELARCLDVIQRAALAHTGVGFTVTHDTRRVLDVEGALDLRGRIRRVFNADLSDALVAIDARDGDVRLQGYVAPPRFARGDTARQMWFLNGRTVKDKVLLRALREGYKGFLFDTRQPVAFLLLSMDPAKVDVNVHPAKAEVRFRDERRLFGFIVNALRESVRKTDMATPGSALIDTALRRDAPELGLRTPSLAFGAAPVSTSPAPYPRSSEFSNASYPRSSTAREPLEVYTIEPAARGNQVDEQAPWRADETTASAFADAPSTIFQVARTYIVRPLADGFEIVDQHALHERITFEALSSDMRRGVTETQRFLVPELIELSRAEVEVLRAHLEALTTIGIDLAVFGETTIAVHGLPARLQRPRPEALVRDVLALVENARDLTRERVLEEVMHRAACRSSVMAGDALSVDEMRSLLARGAHLESDQTCVHGRPTRVRFTLGDLEKAFARR